MNARSYIVLSKAKPGQQLAEAVTDQHGMVLLPAGATLTVNHLQHLQDHGVSILSIQTPAKAVTADPQQLTHRLNHLFSTAGNSEAAMQLRLAIQHYRSQS
ncbi:hypothetical protein [Undibacterium luofuense]|jgi:hypothetical protein|uniref:Uncharacterized protein n=1 Tax=Undibacterium luofuense TaxID=2828733 RepID=A0A941I5X6_9BURK|nr:hypothetical protein [Undibacterium luofuense]MBR7781269.1 hypothetical protein [Undibacterium luofuense]